MPSNPTEEEITPEEGGGESEEAEESELEETGEEQGGDGEEQSEANQ